MYYFCTYFDQYYLTRGLALYHSLREYCPAFRLWVLCMDQATYQLLEKLGLPGLHPIALEEFERYDEQLQSAKQNRSRIEYYFTCTPSLPLYILNNWPEVDLITYLDADLFFFASPVPLFEELGTGSIAIIGHRFPPHLRQRERYGIYNVGWLSFRRDEQAFSCLVWWRERCIEWCYNRCEDGRFADQKYLNDWPNRFQGVVVLNHKGANLAPWNLANYKIHGDRNRIWVDEQPLICFHFHGFKQIMPLVYNPNLVDYKVKPSRILHQDIYALYIQTLLDVTQQVSPLMQEVSLRSSIRWQEANLQVPQQVPLPCRVMRSFRGLLHLWRGILTQQYIIVMNGRTLQCHLIQLSSLGRFLCERIVRWIHRWIQIIKRRASSIVEVFKGKITSSKSRS